MCVLLARFFVYFNRIAIIIHTTGIQVFLLKRKPPSAPEDAIASGELVKKVNGVEVGTLDEFRKAFRPKVNPFILFITDSQ